MRSDAANLLNRLGQNTVKYQNFRDNFADVEPWPLFEAVIRDSRMSADSELDDAALADAAPDEPLAKTENTTPIRPLDGKFPRPVVVPSSPEKPIGLFGRYENASVARRAEPKPGNVRSILKQLGDGVANGRLQCR